MNTRLHRSGLRFGLAPLLCLVLSQSALAERRVTLGIVADGPSRQLEVIRAIFLDELNAVCENEFQIEVPASKQIDGQWSAAAAAAGLDRLEGDRETDIVLALGPVAGQQAFLRRSLRKPTFAPFVTDALQSAPAGRGAGSGVPNLNYLASEPRFSAQLELFGRVAPFKRLAVLIDSALYQSLSDSAREAAEGARRSGIELDFITNAGEGDVLAKVPAEVQAVVVAPLPRLSREDRRALIDGLLKRRLPSLSLSGDDEVAEGLLMSDVASVDLRRRARQLALNIHAALLGEPAADQPVALERKTVLTINMATARAIGLSPRWDVLREAALLNEEEEASGPPLALAEAAQEAVRMNLDVIAGQLGVRAGAGQVAVVRSALFPQVQGGLSYSRRRRDYPLVSAGLDPEEISAASISLTQVIFSESALANLAVQKRLQLSLEAQQRGLELDIVQQATKAFLSALMARTQVEIQENSLRLAQYNRKLANARVEAGKADLSDVSRWDSEIAATRQAVLASKAKLEQARDRLNRLLRRKLEDRCPLRKPSMQDPGLLLSRPEFFQTVDNERAYRLMTRFLVREGLGASPNLAQLDERISAQERQLLSNRLGLFLPQLSLSGEGNRVLGETWGPRSALRLAGQNDWQVGLNLSLPIFQGGGQWAGVSVARETLAQLRAQRDSTRLGVEEAIRGSLHALRSSLPAIRLSQEAADAARRTLDSVTKNYTRGTRSVVDVLDARNASLAADQAQANAVFAALGDLMDLQRGIGEFGYLSEAPRFDERMRRLKAYVANGGD